jgi:hypothetical protein
MGAYLDSDEDLDSQTVFWQEGFLDSPLTSRKYTTTGYTTK